MKNNYDFIAGIYDPVLYLALHPIRVAVLNALLPYKEEAILDLCCGTGNQLKLLSKNGFTNLHGLDISNTMLERVKKDHYPIKIYNEDASKTNFINESFDIVIISMAIHEKNRLTQEKFLNEAYGIIRKDGTMLVIDYVFDKKTFTFGRLGISFVERMAGKEHYDNFRSYIKNNGLSSLIKKERFKLIKKYRKLFNGITISQYQKMNTV